MMFNFDEWKNKKVVMHCKTKEEAEAFCEEMDKAGLTWHLGHKYSEFNYFGEHKQNTCYHFNRGVYGNIEDYIKMGFKILEYSDYMDKPKKEQSTRRKCLEKAIEVVCKDRNDSYGNPENNFGVMADFTTDYLHARNLLPKEKSLTDEDAAVISILFKVARRASGRYKEDTYIDIAGYAACAMEVGEKCNE